MAKHHFYGEKPPVPAQPAQTPGPPGIKLAGQFYSGPLPTPELLQKWEAIHPGAAELIFRTYEKQVTSRIERENKLTESKVKTDSRGQIFAFLLAAGGLGLALAFALLGNSGAALASIIGGIAPIILATVTGLLRR